MPTIEAQHDTLGQNLAKASELAPEYQLKLEAIEKQIRTEIAANPAMEDVYDVLRRRLSVRAKYAKTLYPRLEKKRKEAQGQGEKEEEEAVAAPIMAPPPPPSLQPRLRRYNRLRIRPLFSSTPPLRLPRSYLLPWDPLPSLQTRRKALNAITTSTSRKRQRKGKRLGFRVSVTGNVAPVGGGTCASC